MVAAALAAAALPSRAALDRCACDCCMAGDRRPSEMIIGPTGTKCVPRSSGESPENSVICTDQCVPDEFNVQVAPLLSTEASDTSQFCFAECVAQAEAKGSPCLPLSAEEVEQARTSDGNGRDIHLRPVSLANPTQEPGPAPPLEIYDKSEFGTNEDNGSIMGGPDGTDPPITKAPTAAQAVLAASAAARSRGQQAQDAINGDAASAEAAADAAEAAAAQAFQVVQKASEPVAQPPEPKASALLARGGAARGATLPALRAHRPAA